jgi:hypothetical protein
MSLTLFETWALTGDDDDDDDDKVEALNDLFIADEDWNVFSVDVDDVVKELKVFEFDVVKELYGFELVVVRELKGFEFDDDSSWFLIALK